MASSPRTVVLIVTADHETGGLQVTGNNGPGVIPEVRWTSGGEHTGVNVPFYVYGQDAQLFSSVRDNTEFFEVLRNVTGY